MCIIVHSFRSGSTTTINPKSAEIVTKLYRKDQKSYESARRRIGNILTKVNPDNAAIGLQKSPTFTKEVKKIYIYNPEDSTQKDVKGYEFTEAAYKSDCLTTEYKKTELPSMVACLVQGSKTLLKNEVYHLDCKPDNIGYLGNGQVEHFDLDGSILGDELFINSLATTTSQYTCKADYEKVRKLEEESKEKLKHETKDILSKMHIFSLGASIFNMATNNLPYHLEKETKNPSTLLDESDLTKTLSNSRSDFTSEQITTIIKMVSLDRDERPTIEAIERVFPKTLIQEKKTQ